MGCVRKTSYKRYPQRKEKRKNKDQRKETDKIIDGIFLEFQRGIDVSEDGDEASREHTSTTHGLGDDESSKAEAQ